MVTATKTVSIAGDAGGVAALPPWGEKPPATPLSPQRRRKGTSLNAAQVSAHDLVAETEIRKAKAAVSTPSVCAHIWRIRIVVSTLMFPFSILLWNGLHTRVNPDDPLTLADPDDLLTQEEPENATKEGLLEAIGDVRSAPRVRLQDLKLEEAGTAWSPPHVVSVERDAGVKHKSDATYKLEWFRGDSEYSVPEPKPYELRWQREAVSSSRKPKPYELRWQSEVSHSSAIAKPYELRWRRPAPSLNDPVPARPYELRWSK